VRLLQAAGYRRMPWKNGGGETAEILISPEDAALDAFDWRISMARVASAGPFSSFAGVDRTLTVVDGGGLALTIAADAPRIVTPASAPLRFAADAVVHSVLVGGPVTDLNVMTRRGVYRHQVERVALASRVERQLAADTVLVFCSEGRFECAAEGQADGHGHATLEARDTVILEPADARFTLTATRPGIALVVSVYRIAATPG
jgi:environmental stress-induced protein Ves